MEVVVPGDWVQILPTYLTPVRVAEVYWQHAHLIEITSIGGATFFAPPEAIYRVPDPCRECAA